ncbi:MAG TPA: hypothetical protein V6D37_13200 [Candidatus Sericytochromatia bacterium]
MLCPLQAFNVITGKLQTALCIYALGETLVARALREQSSACRDSESLPLKQQT